MLKLCLQSRADSYRLHLQLCRDKRKAEYDYRPLQNLFEVNFIPPKKYLLAENFGAKSVIIIPVIIAATGAPISENENEPI